MDYVQNNKKKQINEIVSVVKLASLLLTAIILCKYLFSVDGQMLNSPEAYYTIVCLFVPLLFLIAIYFTWTFSTDNRFKNDCIYFRWE